MREMKVVTVLDESSVSLGFTLSYFLVLGN